MNEIVNQFLGSNEGNQLLQGITKQHGIDQAQAQNAVRATAEGATEAMKTQNLSFDNVLKGLGGVVGGIGGGGGLPQNLAQGVTDYVCQKTGLSPAIGGAIVSMVLPKLLEFAKGRGAPV